MNSNNKFNFSNKGVCQYEIGQKCPELAPMKYELKFSFNEKSLDIIVGLANPDRKHLNESWLNISLFIYRSIPTIILTTGYIQVVGRIIIKNNNSINVNDWVNGSDDHVNLVVVDVYNNSYEVKEIRKIQLPMMKTIRDILKNQIECVDEEIKNTIEILERGFRTPWMIRYTDEVCEYVQETSEEFQTGEYIINETKEKVAHVYY